MPQGKFKSGRFRKMNRRTPGGAVKRVYLEAKPGVARCALCKAKLSGIPRMRPAEAKNAPKTAKRPERAYGGYYCSNCARQTIKVKARQ